MNFYSHTQKLRQIKFIAPLILNLIIQGNHKSTFEKWKKSGNDHSQAMKIQPSFNNLCSIKF